MARNMKITDGRSRRTRPAVLHRLGVECLEPRTVLSAPPIVVIAFETGTSADHAPPFPHPEPAFGESVLVVRSVQFIELGFTSARADYFASGPSGKELSAGADRLSAPPGKSFPPPIVSVPPARQRDYTQVVPAPPEGEAPAPNHAGKESPVPYADWLQPARPADPVPMTNQTRGATVNDTVFGMGSPLASGGLTASVSASQWRSDAEDRSGSSALDLLHGLTNSIAALQARYSDLLQVGDAARPASSTAEPELMTLEFTWWLDDVLSDILPPLHDDATSLLPATDEGGLVDIGISVGTLVQLHSRHTENTPHKRETSSHDDDQNAHDTARQEQEPSRQGQSPVANPAEPVIEVVREYVQRMGNAAVTVAASAEEEGGMIESLTGSAAVRVSADEVTVDDKCMSLNATDVRLDAEVGFYQAFELATSPHASDVQAGVTAAEPRDEQ
jgi:hypothetical protein